MKKNSLLKTFFLLTIFAATLFFACRKIAGVDSPDGYDNKVYPDTLGDIKLDTSLYKIDRSQYKDARVFPGLVPIEEPRLKGYKVLLDLDYEYVPSSVLRISVTPQGWFSTGVYAPAGELVEIVIPENVYGLTAQIGAWTDKLDGSDDKRKPLIYSRHKLFPGKNLVRNLYGGPVYIIPERPFREPQELIFSGIVKAPDFVLGETTDAEWKEMIEKTTVPWFELRGKWIIFTLPVDKLKKFPIKSPHALMTLWDEQIQKSYWDWYGFEENPDDPRDQSPKLPWRIVHDIQPVIGAQHSGYPIVATANDNYFKQAVTIESVIGSNWGTYHEIGHNMQMNAIWNFSGNTEVTCNLFSFKVTNIAGYKHPNMKKVMAAALKYVKSSETEPYAKSIDYGSGLGMWVQLMEYYGYDFITYLCKEARYARFGAINDQDKRDFFYEKLSEFTKTDMEPYMQKWRIPISSVSKNKISEKYPLLTEKVWLYDPSK